MKGTRVVCTDLATGESDEKVLLNDWMLVTDGECGEVHITRYANGTATITIKRGPRLVSEGAAEFPDVVSIETTGQ